MVKDNNKSAKNIAEGILVSNDIYEAENEIFTYNISEIYDLIDEISEDFNMSTGYGAVSEFMDKEGNFLTSVEKLDFLYNQGFIEEDFYQKIKERLAQLKEKGEGWLN